MQNKPPTCIGCSLFGDGKGFVKGIYPSGATVKILGRSPDEGDERGGIPFSGRVGKTLKQFYLPILGLEMDEVARDNVLRCRQQLPGKRTKIDDYPSGKTLSLAVDHCRQYDVDSPEIKLVLLLGDQVFSHMYPDLKFADWTGFLTPIKD